MLCFVLFFITVATGQATKRTDDPNPLEPVVESLLQKVEALEARIQAMENAHSYVVSFFAQYSDYHHPINHDNTVLQFDNVRTNVGGAYHPELGQFIAPVAGTYAFYLNVLSDHDPARWMNFGIYVNGNEMVLTQLHDAASLNVAVELNAGDKVYAMKRDGPGTTIYGIDHTTFSGMLVRQK